MADESLRFDIIGRDNASGAFSRVGASAKDMGDRMDVATRHALALDEALKKQHTAARASADATLAAAKADKILADAEHVLRDGALEAEFALKKEAEAARKSGRDADEAAAKNRNFARSLRDVADSARKGGGPAWLGPALALAPAATTLLGVSAGAAIGLGGAFATAGIALGAYGAVAKSVLGTSAVAAKAVTTAQDNYAIAIANGTKKATAYRAEQIAIAKAYNDLSPAQIRLSKELSGISDQWKNFKSSVTPLIAGSLQPWLHGVGLGISNLRTLITPVAPVVKDLGVQFGILMGSSTFKNFMAWVGTTGAAVTRSAGGAVMDLITGLTFLLPQFTPLIKGASDGVLKWADAFARWSSSQKAATQIHDFLAWFHQNGPVVGGLLKNIGGALHALAPGLGQGATLELQTISDFFGLVAKLPPDVAKPLLDVAGVLLTLNKLGVISTGLKLTFPKEGAGKSALAASLGMKLIGGALIVPAAVMIAGSFVPKDTSKQAVKDIRNQPPILIRIGDFLHVTGMAQWVDQYFSHPLRAWAENSVPHFLSTAGSMIGNFFTKTIPAVFALFRDKARLIWDQVEIDVLKMANAITATMGKLPGPLGAPFRAAHKSIGTELAGIQKDVGRTAGQINADWDRLHGKTVKVTFKSVFGSNPVNNPIGTLPGHAAGTGGAAPGWAWTGERGPELVHFKGGETVLSNPQSMRVARGYATGTGPGFADLFSPGGRQLDGAISGMFSTSQSSFIRATEKSGAFRNFMRSMLGTGTGGMGDSGARTHSAAVAQAYAASLLSMYGWSQSQMGSLIPLWNQESGWNAYAVNPSSGAYGIPQSLGHGHPYNLGDYVNQIIWGLNYIRGRYGSPAGAEAHELSMGWYDQGGYLPRGLSLAYNGTGRPEPVGAAAGGTVININVSVPPTVNPRDAGRQFADVLKAYIKAGGTLYPAGVTPR